MAKLSSLLTAAAGVAGAAGSADYVSTTDGSSLSVQSATTSRPRSTSAASVNSVAIFGSLPNTGDSGEESASTAAFTLAERDPKPTNRPCTNKHTTWLPGKTIVITNTQYPATANSTTTSQPPTQTTASVTLEGRALCVDKLVTQRGDPTTTTTIVTESGLPPSETADPDNGAAAGGIGGAGAIALAAGMGAAAYLT